MQGQRRRTTPALLGHPGHPDPCAVSARSPFGILQTRHGTARSSTPKRTRTEQDTDGDGDDADDPEAPGPLPQDGYGQLRGERENERSEHGGA